MSFFYKTRDKLINNNAPPPAPPLYGGPQVFDHPLFASLNSMQIVLLLFVNVPSISFQDYDWSNVFLIPETWIHIENSIPAVFTDKGTFHPKF